MDKHLYLICKYKQLIFFGILKYYFGCSINQSLVDNSCDYVGLLNIDFISGVSTNHIF